MKTKGVLLKFAIIALQLASLAILFLIYFRLVLWVEETYSLQSSDLAWPAAILFTLISLALLSVIFYRWLKCRWVLFQTDVMVLGVILFLVGTVGTRGILHFNKILKHGRETSAISSFQRVYQAQTVFKATNKKYATLRELVDTELIHPSYLNEEGRAGYKFSDTDISTDTFCIHADRIKNGMGNRDFLLTESGEIRFIETCIKGTVPRGMGEKLYSIAE